VELRTHKL